MSSFRKVAMLRSMIIDRLQRFAADEEIVDGPAFGEEPEAATAVPSAAVAPVVSGVPDYLEGASDAEGIFKGIVSYLDKAMMANDRKAMLDHFSDTFSVLYQSKKDPKKSAIPAGLIREWARDYIAGKTIPADDAAGKPAQKPTAEEAGRHAEAVLEFRKLSTSLAEKLFDKEVPVAEKAVVKPVEEQKVDDSIPVELTIDLDDPVNHKLKKKVQDMVEIIALISEVMLRVSKEELEYVGYASLLHDFLDRYGKAVASVGAKANRMRANSNATVKKAAQAVRSEQGINTLVDHFAVDVRHGKPVQWSEAPVFAKVENMHLKPQLDDQGEEIPNSGLEQILSEDSSILRILRDSSNDLNAVMKEKRVKAGQLKILIAQMSDRVRKNFEEASKNLELCNKSASALLTPKYASNKEIMDLNASVAEKGSLLARIKENFAGMEDAMNKMSAKYLVNLLKRIAAETATMEEMAVPVEDSADAQSVIEQLPATDVESPAELPSSVVSQIQKVYEMLDSTFDSISDVDNLPEIESAIDEMLSLDAQIESNISTMDAAIRPFAEAVGISRESRLEFILRRAEDKPTPWPGNKPKKDKKPPLSKKKEIPAYGFGSGLQPHLDKKEEATPEENARLKMNKDLAEKLGPAFSQIAENLKIAVVASRELRVDHNRLKAAMAKAYGRAEANALRKKDNAILEDLVRELNTQILPEINNLLPEIDASIFNREKTLAKAKTIFKLGENILESTGSSKEVSTESPAVIKDLLDDRAEKLLMWAEMRGISGVVDPNTGQKRAESSTVLLEQLREIIRAKGYIDTKVSSYVPHEGSDVIPGAKQIVDIIKDQAPTPSEVAKATGVPEASSGGAASYVEYGPTTSEGNPFAGPPKEEKSSMRGFMARYAEEGELDISAELAALKAAVDAIVPTVESMGPALAEENKELEMVDEGLSETQGKLTAFLSAQKATSEAEEAFAKRDTAEPDVEVSESTPMYTPPSGRAVGQPEMAGASSSKGDEMTREASDYAHFDMSENKLEIIEAEDGKKHIVINKNLKNLVTKRVVELAKGAYQKGSEVHIESDDYFSRGTVKAYLGSGVYRVDVGGIVMDVLAENISSCDSNPWK